MKRLTILLLALALVGSGCAAHHKATLIKADYTLYQAVKAISDTEIMLSQMGRLTPAQSLKLNQALLPAAKLGLEATQALTAWHPGQPLPAQLKRLTKELGDIATVVIATVAEPSAKADLLAKVTLAQQTILTMLTFAEVVR